MPNDEDQTADGTDEDWGGAEARAEVFRRATGDSAKQIS
jgi:hypothetical protein